MKNCTNIEKKKYLFNLKIKWLVYYFAKIVKKLLNY